MKKKQIIYSFSRYLKKQNPIKKKYQKDIKCLPLADIPDQEEAFQILGVQNDKISLNDLEDEYQKKCKLKSRLVLTRQLLIQFLLYKSTKFRKSFLKYFKIQVRKFQKFILNRQRFCQQYPPNAYS